MVTVATPPVTAAAAAATPFALSSIPLQLTVGALCASYWRGAWYVFDYTLFPNDRVLSASSSFALGGGLLAMQQHILSPSYNGTKFLVRLLPPPEHLSLRTYYMKMNRFVSLYGIALACVLVWRGAWLAWDELADQVSDLVVPITTKEENQAPSQSKQQPLVPLEKKATTIMATTATTNSQPSISSASATPQEHHQHHHHHNDHQDAVSHHDIDRTLFYSGIASHVCATVGLLMIGRFKSVMAPPANVSMMKDIFLHGKGKNFARAARSFAHPPAQ
mmetsp:Transcript_12422/g.17645  ORF Transcript_12422/g.17645 Transcript_12422/m.17645 type:complete len:276 (-) Transcript_12422:461-1288(-)